jgi:hypothetical protein
MIAATNVADASDWSVALFDGTNSWISIPYAPHFKPQPRPAPGLVFTTISEGPAYLPAATDTVYLYMPWMVYGLRAEFFRRNGNAAVVLPLPWLIPRLQLVAYGYRWQITPLEPGGLPRTFQIIRDTSLDLRERDEIIRPEIDYPESAEERNRYFQVMGVRTFMPDG